MAAETKFHSDYQRKDEPIKLIGGFQRESGDLGVHFSEAGDKYVFGTVPAYARLASLHFGSKAVDTNATATLTLKVQLRKISAGTEIVLIATFTVANSGAFQMKVPDSEDWFTKQTVDCYLEVESVATPATAATAAKVYADIAYQMEFTD